MKFFYLFTGLVLLWGVTWWNRLPGWLDAIVLCNALLAFVLTSWKLYRLKKR